MTELCSLDFFPPVITIYLGLCGVYIGLIVFYSIRGRVRPTQDVTKPPRYAARAYNMVQYSILGLAGVFAVPPLYWVLRYWALHMSNWPRPGSEEVLHEMTCAWIDKGFITEIGVSLMAVVVLYVQWKVYSRYKVLPRLVQYVALQPTETNVVVMPCFLGQLGLAFVEHGSATSQAEPRHYTLVDEFNSKFVNEQQRAWLGMNIARVKAQAANLSGHTSYAITHSSLSHGRLNLSCGKGTVHVWLNPYFMRIQHLNYVGAVDSELKERKLRIRLLNQIYDYMTNGARYIGIELDNNLESFTKLIHRTKFAGSVVRFKEVSSGRKVITIIKRLSAKAVLQQRSEMTSDSKVSIHINNADTDTDANDDPQSGEQDEEAIPQRDMAIVTTLRVCWLILTGVLVVLQLYISAVYWQDLDWPQNFSYTSRVSSFVLGTAAVTPFVSVFVIQNLGDARGRHTRSKKSACFTFLHNVYRLVIYVTLVQLLLWLPAFLFVYFFYTPNINLYLFDFLLYVYINAVYYLTYKLHERYVAWLEQRADQKADEAQQRKDSLTLPLLQAAH